MRPGVPSFCQRNKMQQDHGFPLLIDGVPLNFSVEEGDVQFWKNNQDHTQPFVQFGDHL